MIVHESGNMVLTSREVKSKLDRQEIYLIPQEVGGHIAVSFWDLPIIRQCAHSDVRSSINSCKLAQKKAALQ